MKKQLKLIVFTLLAVCFTFVIAQLDILAPDEAYQKMQDHHQKMFTQILDVLPPEAKSEAEALQARRETLDEQLKTLHLKAVEVYQNALDQGETADAADTLAREATVDEYTPLIDEHNAFKEDMHAFMQSHPEAMAVFKGIDKEPYMQGMKQGLQGSPLNGNAACPHCSGQGSPPDGSTVACPNCSMQGGDTACLHCSGQGSQHMQGSMGCMGQGKHQGQAGQQGSMGCCCMQGGDTACPHCSGQGSQADGSAAACPHCSMQEGDTTCPHCSGQGSQHMQQGSMGCMQQGKHQGQAGQKGSKGCCCMQGGDTACPHCSGQGSPPDGSTAACPHCSMQGGDTACPHCSGQGRHQGMMQGTQGQGPMQGLLNEQQIKALFVGHTGYIKTDDMEWANIWDGDGNFYAKVSKQGQEDELVGKWSVTNNGIYCVTWLNSKGSRSDSCYRVNKIGNELTLTAASGSAPDTIILDLLPGNPHNLVITN